MADLPAGADDAARRQIRGSSLLLIGRLLSVLSNLVVQVLLVRYLGPSEFGAFAYALSVVTLIQLAVTLGVDRAVPRFLALYDETDDGPRLAGTVLLSVGSVLALGLVVVIAVGLAGGRLVADAPGAMEAAALLGILILLAPIRALEEVQLGILATFAPPRAIFLRRHVLAPALNLIVVGLLVGRAADVRFLATGYVVAGTLGLALSVSLAWSALARRGIPARIRAGEVKLPVAPILGFALPLLTTDALYLLINAAGAIFLVASHGTEAVAAVRAVLPVATLNMLVMTSFTPLYTPLIARLHARGDAPEVASLYWQTAIWMAVVTFPLFLTIVVFAGPITTLLFGPDYASSAPILVILAVGYYVNAALGFNGLTVRILGRMRSVVLVNLVAAILNVALNIMLVPPYGPMGAAVAMSATLVIHNVLKQLALRGTSVGAVSRPATPVYALIAVASVVTWTVGRLLPADLLGYAVSAVLTAVAASGVWLLARPHLRIATVFPEVLRLPFARRLFGV